MKNYFAYKLISPRPSFAADMTEAERDIMGRHVDYWHSLLAQGTAVIFGPVLDPIGSWGLAVVEADTAGEVHALGVNDPAVQSQQGFSYEVYPMPGAIARS